MADGPLAYCDSESFYCERAIRSRVSWLTPKNFEGKARLKYVALTRLPLVLTVISITSQAAHPSQTLVRQPGRNRAKEKRASIATVPAMAIAILPFMTVWTIGSEVEWI
ncbi:MAG: hypothetical protein M1837_004827 [Sclerophora amabilis]|nr:MAG: hypothetical protein M1837_004827 [Sclerophora amabilis]